MSSPIIVSNRINATDDAGTVKQIRCRNLRVFDQLLLKMCIECVKHLLVTLYKAVQHASQVDSVIGHSILGMLEVRIRSERSPEPPVLGVSRHAQHQPQLAFFKQSADNTFMALALFLC